MSWPKFKRFGRWLAPTLLLTFTPKCLLCVLTYAGPGAALISGGPEICGVPVAAAPWTMWLPALGPAAGAVGFFAHVRSRRTSRP